MRTPCFDVRSGMARLVTVPVSRSAADQRRGRAGRTEPGVCYRLWTAEAHAALAERNRPEILQTDLAPLVLELALWGVTDAARLKWLDPPPEAACLQARALLKNLGVLDATGQATDRGRRMAALPLHPRLAHMVLEAQRHGLGADACLLAAVLSERDFIKFPAGGYDSDLSLRLDIMANQVEGRGKEAGRFTVDRPMLRRCLRVAETLRQRMGLSNRAARRSPAGRLLAWAYPDRIGQRRPNASGRFLLANGRGAFFTGPEPLSSADYIVAAELDGERQEARIFLAAACDLQTIQEDFKTDLRNRDTIQWDRRTQAVRMERALKLGALTLKFFPATDADPMKIRAAMIAGIREAGLQCLPWTSGLRRWQERVFFVRRIMQPESWPDISDPALLAASKTGWGLIIDGITRLGGLKGIDLGKALSGFLTWEQRRGWMSWLPPTSKSRPDRASGWIIAARFRCWPSASRKCSGARTPRGSPGAGKRSCCTCSPRPAARCRLPRTWPASGAAATNR